MSKRVLIGGLAAVALALTTGGAAQAQYRGGHGGHYHGGGFGGGHLHQHNGHLHYHNPSTGFYSRPLYVAPSSGYGGFNNFGGINSPYFGFGSGYNNFGGYGRGPGVLNIGYSRPGFGVSFGTIIR